MRELRVIDAIDNGEIDAVGGRGNEHAFGPRVEMRRRLFFRRKNACTFQGNVHAQFLVWQLGRIFDRGDADLVTVDEHLLAVDRDRPRKAAVHRVIAQEVCVRVDRPEIVHAHNDNVAPFGFDDRAQHKPADAPEANDSQREPR